MAKRCIFCGKEFGLFGGGLIMCGGTDQPVCSDCSGLLSQLSPVERAEKALETGRASEPKELEKFLLRERSRQEREAARIEQARQAIRTDKTCLRCGGPMEKYGMKRSIWATMACWARWPGMVCLLRGLRWKSSGVPTAARRNSISPNRRNCPR